MVIAFNDHDFRLEIGSLEKLTCLIRNPKALGSKAGTGGDGSTNLIVPETSGVKVLAPGPSMTESITATKRKKAGADLEDTVSMVDRLETVLCLSSDCDEDAQAFIFFIESYIIQ